MKKRTGKDKNNNDSDAKRRKLCHVFRENAKCSFVE